MRNQEENPEIPIVFCRVHTTGNVYKITKLSSAETGENTGESPVFTGGFSDAAIWNGDSPGDSPGFPPDSTQKPREKPSAKCQSLV